MNKKKALCILIILHALLGGCAAEVKPDNSNFSETPQAETTTLTFPARINEQISEQISVNAECVYPEECKTGTAKEAKLSGETFWDQRDTLAAFLFKNTTYTTGLTEYEGLKIQDYSAQDPEERMSVSTDGTLTYDYSELSIYVSNVLYYDEQFDDYNGNLYQQKTDLNFVSQRAAWNKVKETLGQLGVECDDNYRCFVMDHETMSREDIRFSRLYGQDKNEKPYSKKAQWTEEDDCYYFQTKIRWQGYPLLSMYSGEGIDEDNITAIYGHDGLIHLSIDGFFPLEENETVRIQPPEKVVETVSRTLENLISDEVFEIQRIRLCQKPTAYDPDAEVLDLELVWECDVDVSHGKTDHYIKRFYFAAETLKAI